MKIRQGIVALALLAPSAGWAGPTQIISGTVTSYDRTYIQIKTQNGKVKIRKNKLSPYLADSLIKSLDHLVLVEVPVSSLIPRPALRAGSRSKRGNP